MKRKPKFKIGQTLITAGFKEIVVKFIRTRTAMPNSEYMYSEDNNVFWAESFVELKSDT